MSEQPNTSQDYLPSNDGTLFDNNTEEYRVDLKKYETVPNFSRDAYDAILKGRNDYNSANTIEQPMESPVRLRALKTEEVISERLNVQGLARQQSQYELMA